MLLLQWMQDCRSWSSVVTAGCPPALYHSQCCWPWWEKWVKFSGTISNALPKRSVKLIRNELWHLENEGRIIRIFWGCGVCFTYFFTLFLFFRIETAMLYLGSFIFLAFLSSQGFQPSSWVRSCNLCSVNICLDNHNRSFVQMCSLQNFSITKLSPKCHK